VSIGIAGPGGGPPPPPPGFPLGDSLLYLLFLGLLLAFLKLKPLDFNTKR